MAMTGAAPRTDGSASNTRSGAWTPAEVAYAYGMVVAFRTGLLSNVSGDCTMREYIAQQLNCDGMRVSKKRVCRQEGKATFGKSPVRTVLEIQFAEKQLEDLRRAYLDSVQRKPQRAPLPLPRAPRAATPADTAPGLLLLSLRKLPYPVRLWDGDTQQSGGHYRLDVFTFEDESLFIKTRTDIFVELRPPPIALNPRLVGCGAQTTGMAQAEAVATCGSLLIAGGFHAFVHAPQNFLDSPRGWGVSVVTRALRRNLWSLLDAGGASSRTRLWVAVRPTDQDTAAGTHATGVVTPVRVLPPHAYCQLER